MEKLRSMVCSKTTYEPLPNAATTLVSSRFREFGKQSLQNNFNLNRLLAAGHYRSPQVQQVDAVDGKRTPSKEPSLAQVNIET